MVENNSLVGVWDINPDHSRIGFQARHAMVAKVRGAFNDVRGTAYIDDDNFDNVAVDVVVEMESVDTRNANRNNHLRSPDFFDVATYPQMVFSGSSVDQVEENNFIVSGNLTIRDVTRSMSIPVAYWWAIKSPCNLNCHWFSALKVQNSCRSRACNVPFSRPAERCRFCPWTSCAQRRPGWLRARVDRPATPAS